jgi:hypothetical protein
MKYPVKKIKNSFRADETWDMDPWKGIPVLALAHHMEQRPHHFSDGKGERIEKI